MELEPGVQKFCRMEKEQRIQAQYPNVNGTDDLEETVRIILDKAVPAMSQETQSSSTPVVVRGSEGKGAPKHQISQQLQFYVANGFTIKEKTT